MKTADIHPAAIGEESIPPDEPLHINRLIALHREVQKARDLEQRPAKRDVHPKQHGCVRAVLTVEANLSAELRHGLFAQAGRFDAVVRFSNAKQQNDQLPDAHGAAIKVFQVEGEQLLSSDPGSGATQDFVLVDHPVFFARDAAEMVLMSETFRDLLIGGPVEKAKAALLAAASPDHRFRILRRMAKRPDNPLDLEYWSTTPFKLGPGAIKWVLRPELDRLPTRGSGSADKLRIAMVDTLRVREARFSLCVLQQTDAPKMPVEDATVDWHEAGAPLHKVATLSIPPQLFDTPEKMKFGEDLSFSPWHGLVAHRPLGGINRIRRALYTDLAERRRAANGAPLREPTAEQLSVVFPLAGEQRAQGT